MALSQYVTGNKNKILAAAGGIGLIIAAVAGLNQRTPATAVENSSGQRVWQVNFLGDTSGSGSQRAEGDLYVERLANCDSIDSTSSGKLVCGSDATGGGG